MYGDFFAFSSLFIEHGRLCLIQRGHQLKPFGEPVTQFYYLKRGLARASILHPEGYEKALYIPGPGCIVPQFCPTPLPMWEESLCVEAYTDIEAIAFFRSEFVELAKEQPPLMEQLLHTAVCLQYSLAADMLSQMYDDGFSRICKLLFFHVTNDRIVHSHPKQHMHISQQDIALLTGLDRVNANKILQRLKMDGVIDVRRKHIKILDTEKLLTYCSPDYKISEW